MWLDKYIWGFNQARVMQKPAQNTQVAEARGPGRSASAQTPGVSRGRGWGLTSVVPTPGGPLPDPTGGCSWQGVSVSDEARA